jgi:hypothetical protein
MDQLRKIPLETLIHILQEIYDGGADYIDISGDMDDDGNLRDTLKITVKPEYFSSTEKDVIKKLKDNTSFQKNSDILYGLSEEDINELM